VEVREACAAQNIARATAFIATLGGGDRVEAIRIRSTRRGAGYCLVAGPDGALWFTEDNGNHIGRITTAGSITEFAVPTPSAGPNALAAGPDGALWFEETNARKFGRITTSGAFTEYTLPNGFGGAAGIVTGPDGALWFTDPISNAIGRITLY